MGSLAIACLKNTHHEILHCIIYFGLRSLCQAGQWVYVPDPYEAYENHRVRRQVDEQFAAPSLNRRAGPPPLPPQLSYAEDLPVSASNTYAAPKGRVGPVYTFVKTDPEANFKWGVRHVAGSQYGK